MDLKELQQNFKHHLFNQESPMVEHIVSDELSSAFRLGIYANAYVARLLEVLENDYPVVGMLLGDDEFYELAQAYIQQYPSTYTSLRWFGQNLASLLLEVAPYYNTPCLAEMAKFEWALVDAFNASDQRPITENDIAQVPPDQWPSLSFIFHPSVFSVTYQWNILPIWQAHKVGKPLPEPCLLPQMETCLVWRQDLKTMFRTLEADEAQMFAAAQQDANFSQLCEQLSQYIDDAEQIPLRAVSLLKTWLSQGLISDLRY
ncbi:HvfC/BufC N-terminal domain-containing protein [Kaarinaea lacus]